MKKPTFCLLALSACAASAASPSVEDVALTFDSVSRRVTVNYTLKDAPGIITAMFYKDGNPVDSVRSLGGDVNRYVTNVNSTCSFVWIPEDGWEGKFVNDGSISARVTAWTTNCPPDYMAINLTVPKSILFFEREADLPLGIGSDMYRFDWLLMRKIPAKDVVWRMGSPTFEGNRTANAENGGEISHLVTLTEDYYMGVFMFTQGQYWRLTGLKSGSDYNGDMRNPVNGTKFSGLRGETYSWPEDGHQVTADSIMGKLRDRSGIDSFDLPTEAQWEYACRAGCDLKHYNGDESHADTLGDLAWYGSNSGGTMHPVGLKEPNAWGLYDLYGNTMERCLDFRAPYDVSQPVAIDPKGITTAEATALGITGRVCRGGSKDHSAQCARSAYRDANAAEYSSIYCGLRVACSAVLTIK